MEEKKKKKKRPQEEVICNNCKKPFMRESYLVKRNIKEGRNNYCSRKCVGSTKSNKEHLSKINSKDASHLDPSNRNDEYTLFRDHLRRTKKRKVECDLTLEELKEVWDKQKGICPYSGVKLQRASYKKKNDPLVTMSLDRIVPKGKYTKDNVQFVTIAMNYLKGKMLDEQVRELLVTIRDYQNSLVD